MLRTNPGPGEPGRQYGPAVGEPPLLADPRRWGSLIGVVGGVTFVAGYSSALGQALSIVAWAAGTCGAAAALFGLYMRPTRLGPLSRPRPFALAVYCGCVLGELAVIAGGSRLLTSTGRAGLRPALIALVVGLHFMPLAWAFRERLFLRLGTTGMTLGAAGLAAGALGVRRAPSALAVMTGLALLIILSVYAQGRSTPSPAGERIKVTKA